MEGCEKEMESKSAWRLWIADVALWDFGRGQWCLSPTLAGWHQGEREVSAPQRTARKTPQETHTHTEGRQPGTAIQNIEALGQITHPRTISTFKNTKTMKS